MFRSRGEGGSDDNAIIVDTSWLGNVGTRKVQGGESTIVQEKSVSAETRIRVCTHDVAVLINGKRLGRIRAWKIDGGVIPRRCPERDAGN